MMWSSHALLALVTTLTIPTSLSASPVEYNEGNLAARAATFSNPILWEDYPDLDVFRVGDVFYYSSSTFAFSPGMRGAPDI
jgi:hypothetical protein